MESRYFLFSYTWSSSEGDGNGNLWFECKEFPSNQWLREFAKQRHQSQDAALFYEITILTWKEFKSKEDFDCFRKVVTIQ